MCVLLLAVQMFWILKKSEIKCRKKQKDTVYYRKMYSLR